MKIQTRLFLLSLLTIFILTCNDSTTKINENPTIEAVTLNYSVSEKSLFFSVRTDDPQGYRDVETVVYWLYFTPLNSDKEVELENSALMDNGENGDIIKGDATFTKRFKNVAQGQYRIAAIAFDMDNHSSETVYDTIMAMNNQPPKIYAYNLPYSYEKGDRITLEIKATDPNGYDDIKSVNLEITQPDNTVFDYPFVLNDDQQNGDRIKNDGIYTISFLSNKSSKRQGIWKFKFYALDKANTKSNEIEQKVSNPGVTVVFPDSSESKQEVFTAGDEITLKWDVALIDTLVIEYTTNGNEATPKYIKIAELPIHIKKYQWTIPQNIESKFCKILVYDKHKASRYDVSDEYFEVKK